MNEEEIVRQYADMVYKIAFNYVKNAVDADDVFSETFLAYFKRKRVFESEEHRKAWLIRVTINCAKDFLRGKQTYTEVETLEYLPAAEVRERDLDVRDIVMRLPQEERNLVYFYYFEDMSIKSISAMLGMNENTVKTKLMRTRQKLRILMGEPA